MFSRDIQQLRAWTKGRRPFVFVLNELGRQDSLFHLDSSVSDGSQVEQKVDWF